MSKWKTQTLVKRLPLDPEQVKLCTEMYCPVCSERFKITSNGHVIGVDHKRTFQMYEIEHSWGKSYKIVCRMHKNSDVEKLFDEF